MPGWTPIFVKASPPPEDRAVTGLSYTSSEFAAKETVIYRAWGLQPGYASIQYPTSAAGPITVGQSLEIQCGGHVFWGICKSDLPTLGTGGATRSLEFVDHREYLNRWDCVHGCFNKLEHVQVSGVRLRRYQHILPSNFDNGIKTFSNSPLTAAQILTYMLTARTTGNQWEVYHCDPDTGAVEVGFHPTLDVLPSFDIDCMNGRYLGQAIQEVLDQHGILFTIMDGPYRMVFARKGEGQIPTTFPELSNDRRLGYILSDAPTRVRIIGDRNRYQLHNISMIPDWMSGWEMFFDVRWFVGYVFNNFSLNAAIAGISAGTPYKSIPNDLEHAIGSQLAKARALELTVAEVAAHRDSFGDGNSFRDWRKFQGRMRMEMPAAMYIRNVLFRAFRLSSGFQFTNANGVLVGVESVEISPEMICAVTHDPIGAGTMSWNVNLPSDGGGYAIIKGYQVGQDGFRTLDPHRFNLAEWISTQDIWQHVPFQIDESGSSDGRFIVFDEPVINSADLFVTGSGSPTDESSEAFWMNGYPALNPNPTFNTPPVQAALTLRVERFSHYEGYGARDRTTNIPQLYCEYVGGFENPYSDGQTAHQKAAVIANSQLAVQLNFAIGGYKRVVQPNSDGTVNAGTKLSGVIDRVTIRASAQGVIEEVDLTAEREATRWEPDRDFDRGERDKGMFPGQKQMQEEANQAKMTAAAWKSSPRILRTMAQAFHQNLGQIVVPAVGATNPIKFGSPVKKMPTVMAGSGRNTSTHGVIKGGAAYSVYVGATVHRDGAPGEIEIDKGQNQLVRVMGPVTVGQSVGLSSDVGVDYLVTGSVANVGQANQAITQSKVRVIQVVRSGGTGGTGGNDLWA